MIFIGRAGVCKRQVEHIVHVVGMTNSLGLNNERISHSCNTFLVYMATLLALNDRFILWVIRPAKLALNLRCIRL